VLLPYTETGALSLIGATTENPAHAMNAALLSRCTVLNLKKKGVAELSQALGRARQNGLLPTLEGLSETQLKELLRWSAGDFRTFWNLCEQLQDSYSKKELESLGELALDKLLLRPPRAVGKQSSAFYDLLSAMIKSVRGTDPDAAVYYMTCLLEGGEDPKVLGRRLIISASEDIGNANPRALEVAVAGYRALEVVGLPEAEINLAQVVTYLASSPKSNRSYKALRTCQSFVRDHGQLEPPRDLISQASHANAKSYKSPHNTELGYIQRSHLPEPIQRQVFYQPSQQGDEKDIAGRLEDLDPE
jgi:putative ATPase